MRTLALVLLLAACGSKSSGGGGGSADTPAAKSADTPAKADAPPARPKLGKLTRVGGPPALGTLGSAVELAWCPGDDELVGLDETGVLHRFRTKDGIETASTKIGLPIGDGMYYQTQLSCGPDGAVLSSDDKGQVTLTARDGKQTHAPGVTGAVSAAFDRDGSVLFVANQGVQRWRGDKIEDVIAARPEHQMEMAVANGGTFVERVMSENGPSKAYATVPGGKPVELPGGMSDLMRLSASDDGAIVTGGMMNSWAWMMSDGIPSQKPINVLDASGTSVGDVAANDAGFYAVFARTSLRVVQRPYMRAKMIEYPCGNGLSALGAMAAAHSGPRVALACNGLGVMILDTSTGKPVEGMPSSAGDAIAWSPNGDRLATHDRLATVRVWKGDTVAATLKSESGGGYAPHLWWQSDKEIGELVIGVPTTLAIADGTAKADDSLKDLQIEHVAKSAHGEVLVSWRPHGADLKVKIVGGAEIEPPKSALSWVHSLAIDDSATHALVARGEYSNRPVEEVVELDLAKKTSNVVKVAAAPNGVALGTDGVWVSADGDGVVKHAAGKLTKLWAVPALKVERGESVVTALAVKGDLVAIGLHDGTVALVGLDGTELGKVTAHGAAVNALAFSPDGKRLATIADDGARVFELQ